MMIQSVITKMPVFHHSSGYMASTIQSNKQYE